MKENEMKKPDEKRKVVHLHIRLWWVIGWLLAVMVLLIIYWSDIQKALTP